MSINTYRYNYLCTCGGNKTYGKTLYIFGTTSQNVTSSGNSSATASTTQSKKLEDDSQNNNDSHRLQQFEKVHRANLLEKEDTILNLREVLLQHEKRVLELESKAEGNISFHESLSPGKTRSSPIQKLLDQIDRLQKEKDNLLRKIAEVDTTKTGLAAFNYETNEDLSEQSDLSYQIESCTTDTEKELAKIKHIKRSLDLEIQKLRKENTQLCDKLLSLGTGTSELSSPVNDFSNETSYRDLDYGNSDQLGDSGYHSGTCASSLANKIQYAKNELEHKNVEFYLGDLNIDERDKKRLKNILGNMHDTIGLVYKEFTEVKQAYLALKQETAAAPLSLGEIVKEMQLKVQNSLADVNTRYKEVVEKYLREMRLRKKYHNELVELRGNIRVLCRVRPWIKEDGTEEDDIVVTIDPIDDTLVKINNKGRIQMFDVDKTFGTDSTQLQVFEEVSSLVRSVIDGYNVCIFAYGQTGSGKTHTMEGPQSDPGINQRALQLLFEETIDDNWQYEISAAVLEIYNEVIRDLLSQDQDCKLEVKMKPEGGLHVPGLVSIPVSDLSMVNQLFETGRKNRATASTNMNEHSSRSHCLLCVTVTGFNPTTGSKTLGHLNLVDLAGSERVSKSLADGVHLKEAQNINKSLSCLGDVIHALRNKHVHVPYRNSKLTYLLQDSLGGDSKTLMIVQVSPVEKNVSETVCTLQFGQRVRSVELRTVSKNINGNKSTPSKRPSTLRTSPSVSVSSSLLTLSPVFNCSQSSPSSPSSTLSPSSPGSPSSLQSPFSPISNRSSPISNRSSSISNRSFSVSNRSSQSSPSITNHQRLTTSISSPSFIGKRQPWLSSKAPLKSPTPPPSPRKSPLNPKSPKLSSLSASQRQPVTSSHTPLYSSSSVAGKPHLNSKSPKPVRKLPETPTLNKITSASKIEVENLNILSTES